MGQRRRLRPGRSGGGEARRLYTGLHLTQARDDPRYGFFAKKGSGPLSDSLDRWLFIHLWRRLLRDGDLEQYQEERDRLEDQQHSYRDFYESWHREVMDELFHRGRERMAELEENGESSRAAMVREYLVDSGHFRPALLADLGAFQRYRTWFWWGWVVVATGLVAGLSLCCWGVAATYRRSFFSAHRAGRRAVYGQRKPARSVKPQPMAKPQRPVEPAPPPEPAPSPESAPPPEPVPSPKQAGDTADSAVDSETVEDVDASVSPSAEDAGPGESNPDVEIDRNADRVTEDEPMELAESAGSDPELEPEDEDISSPPETAGAGARSYDAQDVDEENWFSEDRPPWDDAPDDEPEARGG